MACEIELKLELDPSDVRLLREQPLLAAAPSESERLVSIYYDTPKAKLRKSGYSLRVRSAGADFVQTVKSLDPGAGLFTRGEWESPVRSFAPDAKAARASPLGSLSAGKLVPVVRSDVDRTLFSVEENGSLLEIDLDEGVLEAGKAAQPVAELEIELLRGRPEDAAALARRIARRVPVKIAVLSKAERGFALAAGDLLKPSKAEPISLDPGMTVAEAFAVIAQKCLKQFRLNEPLVLELQDAGALHQARVALRRLRSSFSMFKPALHGETLGRLQGELRWLISRLGDARNLDVYLQRQDLTKSDERSARRRRERAYQLAIRALNSPRYRLLMIDLVAWIASGAWRERKKARLPARPFIDKRIDALWDKVTGSKGTLGRMDEHSRHRVRIRVKKLRYALEFAEALHHRRAAERKKFARGVEALQEMLGRLNDLATARELERRFGRDRSLERPRHEKRRLVAEAGRALRTLASIGPYWRAEP